DTYKASGWLLNSKYNWQYVQNNGTPPAVSGSTLSIAGMHNGNYSIAFFSTLTGNFLSATSATVSSGILDILLPDITWDVAFRAIETSVLPLQAYAFSGYRRMSENYLDINISNADNVKNIFIERSSNGTDFTSLSNAVATWNSLAGKHSYIDKEPFKGNNFYRLKILDKDGSISYSKIIKLSNNLVKFGVYPNPVKDNVILNIDEGKYQIKISDQNGRIVESKFASASGNFVIKIPVNKLSSGIYYLSVQDEQGNLIGNEKLTVIH
ncbi:MAG: T9SS type A sorting domain-containing protein, partial [Ginsengibacter sp.]